MFKKSMRSLHILFQFFKDAYRSTYNLYELQEHPEYFGVKKVLKNIRVKIEIIINSYLNPKTNFLHSFNLFVKEFGWGNF